MLHSPGPMYLSPGPYRIMTRGNHQGPGLIYTGAWSIYYTVLVSCVSALVYILLVGKIVAKMTRWQFALLFHVNVTL